MVQELVFNLVVLVSIYFKHSFHLILLLQDLEDLEWLDLEDQAVRWVVLEDRWVDQVDLEWVVQVARWVDLEDRWVDLVDLEWEDKEWVDLVVPAVRWEDLWVVQAVHLVFVVVVVALLLQVYIIVVYFSPFVYCLWYA